MLQVMCDFPQFLLLFSAEEVNGGKEGEGRTGILGGSAWEDPDELSFITCFLTCLEIGFLLFPVLRSTYCRVRKYSNIL